MSTKTQTILSQLQSRDRAISRNGNWHFRTPPDARIEVPDLKAIQALPKAPERVRQAAESRGVELAELKPVARWRLAQALADELKLPAFRVDEHLQTLVGRAKRAVTTGTGTTERTRKMSTATVEAEEPVRLPEAPVVLKKPDTLTERERQIWDELVLRGHPVTQPLSWSEAVEVGKAVAQASGRQSRILANSIQDSHANLLRKLEREASTALAPDASQAPAVPSPGAEPALEAAIGERQATTLDPELTRLEGVAARVSQQHEAVKAELQEAQARTQALEAERNEFLREVLGSLSALICTPQEGYNRLSWVASDLRKAAKAYQALEADQAQRNDAERVFCAAAAAIFVELLPATAGSCGSLDDVLAGLGKVAEALRFSREERDNQRNRRDALYDGSKDLWREIQQLTSERDDLRARHAEATLALGRAEGERDELFRQLEAAHGELNSVGHEGVPLRIGERARTLAERVSVLRILWSDRCNEVQVLTRRLDEAKNHLETFRGAIYRRLTYTAHAPADDSQSAILASLEHLIQDSEASAPHSHQASRAEWLPPAVRLTEVERREAAHLVAHALAGGLSSLEGMEAECRLSRILYGAAVMVRALEEVA